MNISDVSIDEKYNEEISQSQKDENTRMSNAYTSENSRDYFLKIKRKRKKEDIEDNLFTLNQNINLLDSEFVNNMSFDIESFSISSFSDGSLKKVKSKSLSNDLNESSILQLKVDLLSTTSSGNVNSFHNSNNFPSTSFCLSNNINNISI